MRILLVSDHDFLPDRVGGRESSIDELANRLAKRGHPTEVLVQAKRRTTRRPLGSIFWHVAYAVNRVTDVAAAAERHLAAGRFDVAIYSLSDFAEMVSSRPHIRRKQVLYVRDANEIDDWTSQTFRPTQLLLANSAFIAERIHERTGLSPIVVQPIIDFAKYRVETQGSTVTIINPVQQKGMELAFAIAERHPEIPFKFALCWDLDARSIMQLRRRAALLGNVTVVDANLDVRGLYRNTRLLLVPSQWEEGFGRAVIEAQCSGIPVIASRRGGLPEAVGDGGWLIPAEANAETWGNAVADIWTKPALWEEMSARASLRAALFEQDSEANLRQLETALSSSAPVATVIHQPVPKCAAILLPSRKDPANALRSLLLQNCEHLEILAMEYPDQNILEETGIKDPRLTLRRFDPQVDLAPQVFSLLGNLQCAFVMFVQPSDEFDPDFVYALQSAHLNALWTAAMAVCDSGVRNSDGDLIVSSTAGFRAAAKSEAALAEFELHQDAFGFSTRSLPWEVPGFTSLPLGTMYRRDALMLLKGVACASSTTEFLKLLRFGAHLIGGAIYTDRILCWSRDLGDTLAGALPRSGLESLSQNLRQAAVVAIVENGIARHVKAEGFARALFGHFSKTQILALCGDQPLLKPILMQSFLDSLLHETGGHDK